LGGGNQGEKGGKRRGPRPFGGGGGQGGGRAQGGSSVGEPPFGKVEKLGPGGGGEWGAKWAVQTIGWKKTFFSEGGGGGRGDFFISGGNFADFWRKIREPRETPAGPLSGGLNRGLKKKTKKFTFRRPKSTTSNGKKGGGEGGGRGGFSPAKKKKRFRPFWEFLVRMGGGGDLPRKKKKQGELAQGVAFSSPVVAAPIIPVGPGARGGQGVPASRGGPSTPHLGINFFPGGAGY